jgi:hypothetical protein
MSKDCPLCNGKTWEELIDSEEAWELCWAHLLLLNATLEDVLATC